VAAGVFGYRWWSTREHTAEQIRAIEAIDEQLGEQADADLPPDLAGASPEVPSDLYPNTSSGLPGDLSPDQSSGLPPDLLVGSEETAKVPSDLYPDASLELPSDPLPD